MEQLDAPADPSPPRPGNIAFTILGVLLAAGIVLTWMLVREHARIDAGVQEEGILCGAFGGSCRAALISEDAYIMGVPVAYLGFGWYVGLAVLAACAWAIPTNREGWPAPGWTLAFCVAGILGMFPAVYFTLRMFTSTYGLCGKCLSAHIVATLLFLTTLLIHIVVGLRHAAAPPGAHDVDAGDGLARAANIPARMGVAVAVVTGLATVLTLTLAHEARTAARLAATIEDLKRDIPGVLERLTIESASSVTSEEVTAMIAQDPPPSYGNPQAQVVIRVFVDLSCGKCADAVHDLQLVAAEHEAFVRLEVFMYPFESECNPYTPLAHGKPYLCAATRALIAARKQGAATSLLEYILSRQPYLRDANWKVWGDEIGLDGAKLVADMASDETTRYLQRDLDLGHKIKIEGTPAIIVGEHVLKGSTRAEDMFALIKAEIERAYGPAALAAGH